jgi:nucleoside-diphosphate-sugar epimerase
VTARIAVVGASGRVGSAVCAHLRSRYEVVAVGRRDGETVDELAARAVAEADLVINAAGVAHVERQTAADLERLTAANVEFPIALAAAALDRAIPMVHISSVKAVPDAPTPYGRSKYEGDTQLETRFGSAFADANLGLVIVRPLALLFPPLDAGKVSRLRFLRWWPRRLTPQISLPVLAPHTFLAAVDHAVDELLAGRKPGVAERDFATSERGTLRDVRDAMSARVER